MANGDPYGIDPVICCAAGICCRNRSEQRSALTRVLVKAYDNSGGSRERREEFAAHMADYLLDNHLVIMPEYVAATFRFMVSGSQPIERHQPLRDPGIA